MRYGVVIPDERPSQDAVLRAITKTLEMTDMLESRLQDALDEGTDEAIKRIGLTLTDISDTYGLIADNIHIYIHYDEIKGMLAKQKEIMATEEADFATALMRGALRVEDIRRASEDKGVQDGGS